MKSQKVKFHLFLKLIKTLKIYNKFLTWKKIRSSLEMSLKFKNLSRVRSIFKSQRVKKRKISKWKLNQSLNKKINK